jgi:DNA-binding NarL/FixJ family response regulator
MSEITYIAIVDDHVMFRQGLTHLVNLFPNYKVLFDAENGRDFISKLNPAQLPQIVLMDISMPEMDGYATAQWLRGNYPEMKVLALSMLDSDSAIIKMIKHGARGYILKDANTEELKLAFKEVVDKGYYYNEVVSRKLLQSINLIVNENSDTSAFLGLSERETAFLQLVCSEKSYKEIAAELFVSERTIDGYRDTLFKKLNITTRVGLVLYAIKNGLVRI